ncbi:MAG: hypothetical protein C4291_09665 [Candidatus Dadabacteria bacterium]
MFVTRDGRVFYSLPSYKDFNPKSANWVILKEEIVGGKVMGINGEGKTITKVSYFRGNEPSKWRSKIRTYDTVSLGEVYKGIELRLRAYGNSVEKLFYVKPGADVEEIRVRINSVGASLSEGKALCVNEYGELEVKTKLGAVKFTKPVAYQLIGEKKNPVKVKYFVKGNEYGFKVGVYDRANVLVIDPLLASTFLGGGHLDRARSIAIDPDGNVYVAGITQSLDFPTTDGAFDISFNGGNRALGFGDIFISKLSGDLTTLLSSTFLGGSSDEEAISIAISGGDVYLTGFTQSPDFPTTAGAFQTSFNGGVLGDAFVSRLSGDLGTLLASTYLGGKGNDQANSIAIDSSGDVYVAGGTGSSDFPVTIGALKTSCGTDRACNGKGDAFISKLSGDLTTLLSSTYLGGGDVDDAFSIALSGGSVYVTGQTSSSDFPTTDSAFQNSLSGGNDVFVSRLSADLKALLASTFLGGTDEDGASSMVIDSIGDVYVAGFTASSDFPTTPEAFQRSLQGTEDAFISKLSGDLTTLLASTYLGSGGNKVAKTDEHKIAQTKTNSSILGGSSENAASSIALGSNGDVFVAGFTESPSFPTTIGAFDSSCGTDGDCNFSGTPVFDAFISKLSGDLTTLFASTYLGGSNSDQVLSIAIGLGGDVYVAGQTLSLDFPITTGAFQTSLRGPSDAFVSELDPNLSSGGSVIPRTDSGGGGCVVGGSVRIRTGAANLLILIIPVFAISLRMLIRRKGGQG